MKLIRFKDRAGQVHTGMPTGPGRARLLRESPYVSLALTDEEADVAHIMAPIDPINIIAIGLNYQQHAAESGLAVPDHPLVFAKFTSSVIGPEQPIVLPADAPEEVDYEALKKLATMTGGRTYQAVDPNLAGFNSTAELEQFAGEIARGMRVQYRIGYAPTNKAKDGKFRRLRVSVTPPPGSTKLEVWTKEGYHAPKPAPAR